MVEHVRIVGRYAADRSAEYRALAGWTVVGRCPQRLRGPYTGVDTILREVVDAARQHCGDLIDRHRTVLLYVAPELDALIGPGRREMAAESAFQERTRYYEASMIRCMSQGVVTFLLGYARRRVEQHAAPLTVVFEAFHDAGTATRELAAILVRRADPAVLRVVVSGTAAPLPADCAHDIDRHTRRRVVTPGRRGPAKPVRGPDELVAAYVASDGTTDEPDEIDAYRRADDELVRRLHDRRADELEPTAGRGVRIGALAYHREHGSDSTGAGAAALLDAQHRCVETGFTELAVELGRRGRALTDPAADPERYCEFAVQAGLALVPLGRLDEALALFGEVRRFTLAKYHMVTSYAIAMMHTRFFQPRDHDTALEWQHNAMVIARLLPDPRDRLVYGVFQDNGLALIQMHRGELAAALTLVEDGIARLDAELGEREWLLHRSQLRYNRARLLVALGRADEAEQTLSELIELDPCYTDYLSERAKIYRRSGRLDRALADYDRAELLGPPFPELFYNRGTARAEAGDPAGALADFDHVLDMEPADVDTRLSRAELLLETGEDAAAEADVAAGLALQPDEPRLLCLHGTLLLRRGALTEALAALTASLSAADDYPAALVNRAVVQFRLERPDRSVADLTHALRLVGDDADLLLNRAIAWHASGDVDRALDDLTRALRRPDADVAEIRYQRGRCLLDAGRPGDAAAEFRECQRLGRHGEEIAGLLAAATS